MKINHNVIRGILKWGTFAIFAISVGFKLKAILKYGGTTPNKDPNEDIENVEDSPVPQDYDEMEEDDYEEEDEADDEFPSHPTDPMITETYRDLHEASGN